MVNDLDLDHVVYDISSGGSAVWCPDEPMLCTKSCVEVSFEYSRIESSVVEESASLRIVSLIREQVISSF
jgi:hypothetical protein